MRSMMGLTGLVAAALLPLPAGAGGNVVDGEAIFNRTCLNCHAAEIGVNKVGPSLHGILGRKSASIPDFNYSDALKASAKVWNAEEIDLYLSDPRGTMHGVRMFFKGLPEAQERADVIAYLATLK
jgi:cytochrome c